MSNKNKPAMPVLVTNPQTCISHMEEGLTKREHFAGLAMQGWLARCATVSHVMFLDPKDVAEVAISMADELLKQLEK